MTDLREAIALALYECEKARSDHADKVLSQAAGKPVMLHMEPWEEVADVYQGDADAVLAVLPDAEALALALEPFATFSETFVDDEGWKMTTRIIDWFGPSDFRLASAALANYRKGTSSAKT